MKITDKNGVVYQLVPVDSLKHWLSLVEINPRDLAPRISAMIYAAPEPELPGGLEPVITYHKPVDCGEYGAFELEMHKLIPRNTPLIQLSSALAALAEKDAEIAKHEEESGRVIAWQLKTIERQAALIEKFRQKLFSASICHPNGVLNLVEEALAAIDEHLKDGA